MKKTNPLKKSLSFFGVLAIVIGTIVSGGFFLLPGLVIADVGSTIVAVYIIALLPLIPSMFSMIELSTAMPRSGGIYFILDRTLGPYFGTIGGIGTWLSLILKVAFALIGMGAYLTLFFPELEILPVALGFVIFLSILNIIGAKKSSSFQIILAIGLVSILLFFILGGIPEIKANHFNDLFNFNIESLFSAAGIVFVSYIGITKVISLSEEIKNPEKNIPMGIFTGLGISVLIYILGTIVMVGLIPYEDFVGNLTPVAFAAEIFSGKFGSVLVSIAALLAFVSVANAGIMSASRYPLAMSRDHIIPDIFRKTNKKGTPIFSIIVTGTVISIILFSFDPTKIAKLASAFQLFLFALICFAVIIMRESKIESYDPGYLSPFYPYMQLAGIFLSFVLIIEMGIITIAFSLALVLIATTWYFLYVRHRVMRTGAIYNLFERLGQYKYAGIDYELRDLMKRKKPRKDDPFDEIVANSVVYDFEENVDFDFLTEQVSKWLAEKTKYSAEFLNKQFMDGSRIGATPVIHEIALPHLIIDDLDSPCIALVRAKNGIRIKYDNQIIEDNKAIDFNVKAIFFLVSPKNNPTQHLRILARIAGRVEENSFMRKWNNAKNDHELKLSLFSNERLLLLKISPNDDTIYMVGKSVKELELPNETLIAWIRRHEKIIIPDGYTTLQENDILTIIGEPQALEELTNNFELIRSNYYD